MPTELQQSIDEVVLGAVKAKAQAAIVEAFGGTEAMIEKLIDATLNAKVPNPDLDDYARRDSRNHVPFLATYTRKVIREQVLAALRELVEEEAPRIKAELKRQIVKNKEELATALMASAMGAAELSAYHVRVSFEAHDRLRGL